VRPLVDGICRRPQYWISSRTAFAKYDASEDMREIPTDSEGALVDLRGQPAIVLNVADQVLQPVDQILATLFPGLSEGCRVSETACWSAPARRS